MSLENNQERINTQIKLVRLATRWQALSSEAGGDEELREMTMESLKRTMNQLHEKIALYDAHHGVAGAAT